jgi:hypothetical protein
METLCYGDVLLRRCFVWRRFVKETFRVETFCMCANLLKGPGEEKNAPKKPVLLPRWPSAEIILLRSWHFNCGSDFTSRNKKLKRHSLKGTIRKFLKVLSVLSLGLRNAMTTSNLPTLIVRMSL